MAQKFTRYTAALLTAVAAMLTLSGCFVVPLADGRSPFDDPNGASFADINNALPEIQTALTEANPGGTDWEIENYQGSENCEGPCNLHVVVSINPVADFSTSIVPDRVLGEVLRTVAPVAEQHEVDLRVQSGRNDAGSPADLTEAAEQFFGRIPDEGLHTDQYSVDFEPNGRVEIQLNTRKHTDVLHSMGLN